MNKQIEEMAKTISTCPIQDCNHCAYGEDMCNAMKYAKRAYANGYRKASDVARDILGNLTMLIKTTESQEFFNCSLSWVVESDSVLKFIDELKKKYESEGAE